MHFERGVTFNVFEERRADEKYGCIAGGEVGSRKKAAARMSDGLLWGGRLVRR